MKNKQYKIGVTLIEGVEILRDFLNNYEELKTGGIQRSFSSFSNYRCENGVDELLGEPELKEGKNIVEGEFELPIFDYCNELLGTVRIYGVNEFEYNEQYEEIYNEKFIIKEVRLEKLA